MAPVFLELTTPELTTIISSSFGLVFSLFSFQNAKKADTRSQSAEQRAIHAENRAEEADKRSIEGARRSLELEVASEKRALLVDIRTIRTASERRLWKLRSIKAESEALNLPVAIELASESISVEEAYLSSFDEIDDFIRPIDPARATHDDLVLLRGKASTILKERTAED